MLPGRRYSPGDIWFLVKKWKWLIVVLWVIVGVGAVLIGKMMPDKYRSESLIQVVPQRVPENFVRSTVTSRIEDRLPAISQQILSRTRLERIIQDFTLYTKERKTELMEDIVAQMRKDIDVEMVKGDAFRVKYESTEARTAMKVTERLASLFVEENLRDREVLAEGANQFLDSQLDDARRRLLDHEKKLEEYRRQYSGQLPSQLQSNLQTIGSMQAQVAMLSDSINRDRDRRLILERQIADLNVDPPSAAPSPAAGLQPVAADAAKPTAVVVQLEIARSQFREMELRLKSSHPDMLRMKRIITELEKKAEAEASSAPVSVVEEAKPVSPLELVRQRRIRDLKLEMEAVDRQIAEKESGQKKVQRSIGDYQGRVETTPTRESEMIALTRDYETLQKVYTNLLAKSEDAKVAANLERRQIGEQFKVIDAARLPERPFSPDRTLINAGGIVGGLLLGFALIALIEVLDSSFRTDQDVVAVLALPVLATIPAIMTRDERRIAKRRKWVVAAVGMSVVVSGVAILAWKLDLINGLL